VFDERLLRYSRRVLAVEACGGRLQWGRAGTRHASNTLKHRQLNYKTNYITNARTDTSISDFIESEHEKTDKTLSSISKQKEKKPEMKLISRLKRVMLIVQE
jgi:hypothetical protein